MIKKLLKITLVLILFNMLPLVVKAATLYFLPQSQTLYQDETFIAEVRVNTESEAINVCAISLNFPTDQLEIIDVIKGGSILSLWPEEPLYSNEDGSLSFIGGVPEGFMGDGKLISLTFRAIGDELSGSPAQVRFKEDSKVLLNDGQGTEASLSFLIANYEITKKPANLPQISSRSHPDQNKWYSQNILHLRWDLIEGAEYSYILSQDPLAEPDNIPDKPEGELIWLGDMEYKNLEDGIYYFALKQKILNEDWQRKVTFRAMVDATPPEPFELEISQDPSVFEGKHFLSFYTTDNTSGLDYFEIIEGKRDPKRITSPYLLEDQKLQSKITVRAVDKAGNERISEILPPERPFPYLAIILILIAIAIIFIAVRIKILMKNKNQAK